MTTDATTRTLDELVAHYADLQHRSQEIADQMNNVKAEIRDRFDVGTYAAAGLRVTIREPNRTFDLNAAVAVLPEELRPQCQVVSYDPKKVKGLLAVAEISADLFMKPGAGNRVVSIS